jgi:hypothetical protein
MMIQCAVSDQTVKTDETNCTMSVTRQHFSTFLPPTHIPFMYSVFPSTNYSPIQARRPSHNLFYYSIELFTILCSLNGYVNPHSCCILQTCRRIFLGSKVIPDTSVPKSDYVTLNRVTQNSMPQTRFPLVSLSATPPLAANSYARTQLIRWQQHYTSAPRTPLGIS